MTLATYNKQHDAEIQQMKDYIESLKKLDKKQARKSLIRTGVLNENGTLRKKICR